ncbi:protein YgfX [Tatumella citrea]|uniref:protein YgfX n=1 Tax=Tatumella citrea TaxID=53336 RepID=UPI0012F8EFC2|nr:protein YgfX [Tatumella citrea]
MAGRIQWLIQFLLLVALLCSPWPLLWSPLKLLSFLLVWQEGKQARRRFSGRCGKIELDNQGIWYWQQQRWRTVRNPGWLPWAVLLTLENEQCQRMKFWLIKDAMPEADWRGLRMHWFYCCRLPC